MGRISLLRPAPSSALEPHISSISEAYLVIDFQPRLLLDDGVHSNRLQALTGSPSKHILRSSILIREEIGMLWLVRLMEEVAMYTESDSPYSSGG